LCLWVAESATPSPCATWHKISKPLAARLAVPDPPQTLRTPTQPSFQNNAPRPPAQATLLADGRVIFCGPCAGLAPWLAAAFCRPYNPAAHGLPPDFALALVSTAFGAWGGGADGRAGPATAGELAAAADTFRALQQQMKGQEGRGGPPAPGRGPRRDAHLTCVAPLP
jgi:hypothetical protein